MEAPDLRCEKYDSLPCRVACSDQRHILAFAEFGFDGRGPVGDTGSLERFEISDAGSTISHSGSDDDASREDRPAFLQFDFQWIFGAPKLSAAFEPCDLQRHSDFCPKLLRLVEGACRKSLTRNPRRK